MLGHVHRLCTSSPVLHYISKLFSKEHATVHASAAVYRSVTVPTSLPFWTLKNFFFFIFISWRLITLQYCSGFCHTLTWISHGFTCVPHPDPPSHLPPHPSLWVFPVHSPEHLSHFAIFRTLIFTFMTQCYLLLLFAFLCLQMRLRSFQCIC